MERHQLILTEDSLRVPERFTVTAWSDPLVERLGYRLDSPYFFRWWAPTLGPTATLLAFNLAAAIEDVPLGESVEVVARDLARMVGVGANMDLMSRHNPFTRGLARLVRFETGRVPAAGDRLEIRRRVPMLNARQLGHLPASLQERHAAETVADGHRAA
ncbi:MAG TPA: hypothetical protein VHD87_12860 [Acidimicrobiales bacterium]|nr:hypothetical protein [Acidimicrobiales bacterium]